MKITLSLVFVIGAISLSDCAQSVPGQQGDKIKLNIMGDGKKPMPKLGANGGGL